MKLLREFQVGLSFTSWVAICVFFCFFFGYVTNFQSLLRNKFNARVQKKYGCYSYAATAGLWPERPSKETFDCT